jgi:hypothetical protein
VNIIQELLGRNSSVSSLEILEYGSGILCADHGAPSEGNRLLERTTLMDNIKIHLGEIRWVGID